jgi:uncharacterized protein (DUF2147 family)
MQNMKYLSLSILLLFSFYLKGQNQAVLGIWRTIDDATGQPKSHVELYMKSGKMFGKVVELLPAATTRVCNNCPGEKNGKSLIGMDILWNMEPDGQEWASGQIVDPKNGKIYSCALSLDGPDKLNVRGYIGISLLGRTQTWHRVK